VNTIESIDTPAPLGVYGRRRCGIEPAKSGTLAREDVDAPRVSGGGSGSFDLEAASGLSHELQCGS
jgi:hypothetical protein